MKRILTILSAALVVLGSCSKTPEVDMRDWTVPGGETDTTGKTDPVVDPVVKPRYVWIDASANFQYFANDEQRIKSDLQKIADCGFTDVIVDVRPTDGVALWDSKVAPKATKLGAWVGSDYKFINRTATFDYLKAFVEHGHEAGLRVNAAMNTFVGGYKYYYGLGSVGPVFDGSISKDWVTVDNTSDGLMNAMDLDMAGTRFLNPANDNVVTYLLKLIAEIAAYDVDGIILDRCRYDDNGLQSDFSEVSRRKFEEYRGSSVASWPTDVFSRGTSSLPNSLTAVQKQWMSFRVKMIHDFVEKASAKVHEVNPDCRFGCYVGAWYSSYYESGVNWASPKYTASNTYRWANADYSKFGYADHCDFMMLGCYASTSSIYGSTEWTMEGFCKVGKKVLCGDTVFAGGPDIGNGSGFEKGGCQSIIPKTVDACINVADGYFCFDLCHIRMYDYWDAYKKAFEGYTNNK